MSFVASKKKKKILKRGIAIACGGQAALVWEVHVCFQEMLRHQANSRNSTFSLGGTATGARSLPPQRTWDSAKLRRIGTREFVA